MGTTVNGQHRPPSGPTTAGRAAVISTALVGLGASTLGFTSEAQASDGSSPMWGAISHCESGGKNVHTLGAGSTASGYFQITNGTWLDNGGGKYAPTAQGATFAQQLEIANRIFSARGTEPWNESKPCWAKLIGVAAHPEPGVQRITTPPPPPPQAPPRQVVIHAAAPAASGGTYTVVRGDTLSGIAGRFRVPLADLYNANRAVVGGNPNLIRPGQMLTTTIGGAHVAPAPVVSTHHAAPLENPLPTATHHGNLFTAAHRGVDLDAPLRTPIYTAFAGVVSAAGPASGFGNWIVITGVIDGQTVSAVYGHEYPAGLLVHVGEQVTAGEQIGNIGQAGSATGPHVHFEIWVGGRFTGGHAVDPQAWMYSHGITV